MSITKQSSDALAARLAAIAPEIKAKLVPALVKSAEEVAGRAEALAEASRRSGGLIESIEAVAPGGVVTAGGESAQLHDLQAAAVATAPHGHLVEFGTDQRQHKSGKSTGKMPAQPFLLPAWRLSKTRVDRRIARAIREGIKAAVAGGNGGGDA